MDNEDFEKFLDDIFKDNPEKKKQLTSDDISWYLILYMLKGEK